MDKGVAAVNRALTILQAYTETDEALTLSALASRTGFYKSTILRLLESLIEYKYIVRLDDGRYALGATLLKLGTLYQRTLRPSNFVKPAIRKLAAQCGESVAFYVREGNARVCLYRIDSAFSLPNHVCEGDTLPLERGAGGKVLLAFAGTPGEVYDDIRARMVYGELRDRIPELSGVASPVFGPNDILLGSLNVAGPVSRLTRKRLMLMEPVVKRAAAALTSALGGDTRRFNLR